MQNESSQFMNETLNSTTRMDGCNSSHEEVYCRVFENRPLIYISIAISTFIILINMGLLLGIIWYERNFSDSHTQMNKLHASVCWTGVGLNLYTVLDILRFLLGPRPPSLCFFQMWFKFSLFSVYLLLKDAIIISKYILIFRLKNPGAINDDFWYRFITVWVCVASILYDGTRLILPGRLNASYYMCTGTRPISDDEEPIRGRALVEISTVILYIVVLFRILINKKEEHGVPVRRSAVSRFRIEDLVNLDKSAIATTTSHFLVVFIIGTYIFVYGFINNLKHTEYNAYPNNYIIIFHLILFGPLVILYACLVYYFGHKPLRQTLVSELKQFLNINDNMIFTTD